MVCRGSFRGNSSELFHRSNPLSRDFVNASLANRWLMLSELSLGQFFLVPPSILVLLHFIYIFEARSLEHLSLRKRGLTGSLEDFLFNLIRLLDTSTVVL